MSGSRSSARPVPRASGGTGAVLVLGSAVAWSLAGLFTRLIEADLGAILFWRGLSGAAFILAYVGWREGDGVVGALGRLGRPGWAAATVGTLATVAFIAALRRTEVANVVLIYASAPFVAALLAWLVLREPPGRSTMAASCRRFRCMSTFRKIFRSGEDIRASSACRSSPTCGMPNTMP